MLLDRDELRVRLAEARLMLLFTPELCGSRDPYETLARAMPFIDVVQVRPKRLAAKGDGPARELSEARATVDVARRVLALVRELDTHPLVLVNDRVDVAHALAGEGVAGVHLGHEDTPPSVAREVLGETPLIGLSTHSVEEVALAEDEPVDYLGFGPVHATATKGYTEGLGAERAWVASDAAPWPLFPIGGIDETNVDELARVGRAVVGSAVLGANDPGAAAEALRARLGDEVY